MTDRVRHLTVTLDEDFREDDLAPIVAAIEHVRGVASVEHHVVETSDHLARQAVYAEVRQKLHEAVEGVFRRQDLRERIKER
jgi:hypothetical protein